MTSSTKLRDIPQDTNYSEIRGEYPLASFEVGLKRLFSGYVQEDPCCSEADNKRGASVANEGKSGSGGGENDGNHCYINSCLKANNAGEAHRQKLS